MASNRFSKKETTEKQRDFRREISLGFLLRDVGRTVGRALAVRIEPLGTNVSTWFMLRLLSENEGLTQREISKLLGIVETSAVETLQSMEKQKLITRVRNPDDLRKMIVRLTPKGWALLQQITPIAVEINDTLESCGTPEEVEVLRRMLQRLRGTLRSGPDKI